MVENPFLPLSFIAGPAILINACAVMLNAASIRYTLAIGVWRDLQSNLHGHETPIGSHYTDPKLALIFAPWRAQLIQLALILLYGAVAGFAFPTLTGLLGALTAGGTSPGVVALAKVATLAAALVGLIFVLAAAFTFVNEGRVSYRLLRLGAPVEPTRPDRSQVPSSTPTGSTRPAASVTRQRHHMLHQRHAFGQEAAIGEVARDRRGRAHCDQVEGVDVTHRAQRVKPRRRAGRGIPDQPERGGKNARPLAASMAICVERDRPERGCPHAARWNGRRAHRSATTRSRSSVPLAVEDRTFNIKWAPRGDQRMCCCAFIRRCNSHCTVLSVIAVEIGSSSWRAVP